MYKSIPRDVLTTDSHSAEWKHRRIIEQIVNFQNQLDDDSEVGILLASFGKEILLSVEHISFQSPDLMYFYGYINGHKAQLIQHQSQLNFLLVAVPKENPNKPARRIGFHFQEKCVSDDA